MVAKSAVWLWAILGCFLSGCAIIAPQELTPRIALLAPFEGRYREVGYNAYYAIRLAFADANVDVEFLPIDDGGSPEIAVERAQALAVDPQVRVTLLLGYAATDAETQRAFGDMPLIIIGHWSAQPQHEGVFMLASNALNELITAPPNIDITNATGLDTPVVGGDVFALAQLPMLREALEEITVVSSASLASDEFRERYLASAEFAPEPGLLAMLAYDAASMALQSLTSASTRSEVQQALSTTSYEGFNGAIRFENGYWADAPIFTYAYDDNRQLTPVDRVVEQG